MFLQKLSLINFKNYETIELEFTSKINCFVGNNGVGKSNLLDAVYYLSSCKSFFDPIDSHNIRHNENFFVIQGNFFRNDAEENIYCALKRNQRKQFKRNKIEYEKLSEHIGLLPLVIISPADGSLIYEGSEERRKFINNVISQYDKSYLDSLIAYNRALQQRNTLLKNLHEFHSSAFEIEAWNKQLVDHGNVIYQKRMDFIERFIPIFQEYYQYISLDNEQVELKYESQLHYDHLGKLLEKAFQKDSILQYTTQGIHKDDLELKLKNHQIKTIGSQGQQKTFLISLKLAQFDFIAHINGFKPILLLDDIFDKLDAHRVRQIVHLVAGHKYGQIFITDTNSERLNNILSEVSEEYKLFKINDGQAELLIESH